MLLHFHHFEPLCQIFLYNVQFVMSDFLYYCNNEIMFSLTFDEHLALAPTAPNGIVGEVEGTRGRCSLVGESLKPIETIM